MEQKNRQLIVEIFDEIFDAPNDKEKILNLRCGNDADLRLEIEKMLIASEKTDDDFLEKPIFENAFRSFEQAAKGDLIGQKLGKYELISLIGEGGMGAVYLGERHDKEFTQKVAVKVISWIFTGKAISENFRRERQILAKLNHPAITSLLDGGTMENGTLYFVMEYVEGISLLEFCQKENLDIKQRLKLFLEVCEAVKFAHQNLIIHRDLKPANILVNKHGKPKLLDFGVAKLLNPEFLDITHDFTVGTNILTPNYASPEQLKGENITTASDVYSLGVILYEMLTGKRPHNLKSKSLPEMLKIITEEIPILPSEAALSNSNQKVQSSVSKRQSFKVQSSIFRWQNRERIKAVFNLDKLKFYLSRKTPRMADVLPSEDGTLKFSNPQMLRGDIDTIVLKSLAKDTNERYLTVEELTADILRYLNDLPILARKHSKIYQFQKFVHRNKIAFYSSAAIAVLLFCLAGLAFWSARVSAHQARENLRLAYSSDMNLAMQSYESANLVRLRQILDKYKTADFRGWEYDFLQNLANPANKIQTFEYQSEVWNVAFSPDGKKLATACSDGFARIYEVPSGKLLTTTSTKENNVWQIKFSPDGTRLATASGDSNSSSAKIWNTENGAEIVSLQGHTARVRAIDFSPDGKTIATGSRDGSVRIWNAETGAELKKSHFDGKGKPFEINDLSFLPDGKKLIVGHNDGTLVLETVSGKTLHIFSEKKHTLTTAVSPDGLRIASGGQDFSIQIYDAKTYAPLLNITNNGAKVNDIAFSPDGKLLASASSDRTIRFFEMEKGTQVQILRVHFADAWSVVFSADGKYLASGGTDFNAFVFDIKKVLESSSFGPAPGVGGGFSAISPDKKTVAANNFSTLNLNYSLYDVENKSPRFVLSKEFFQIGTFSPDGATLATGTINGEIVFFNTANGAEIRRFKAHERPASIADAMRAMSFSPDGKLLVSGGNDNFVKVWNAETAELVRELYRSESYVSRVAISPDSRKIVAASYDLTAKLFDLQTGAIIADLGKQPKPILSIEFAPDGKTFVTGGADGVIKIWQTADGKLLDTLTGNAGFIWAIAFTPDGTRLASASGEGIIRLWDTETRAQVLAINTNSAITGFLAFTPDGKTLISHGTQEKIRLWETQAK